MNRVWLIGGALVLVMAGIIGWLNAGKEATLQSALVLADVTTPGCDGPGQIHLVLGNAAERPMLKVSGVLSIADSSVEQPIPVGNFEIAGPIATGQKVETCAAMDEALIAGRDRGALMWLARPTAVEFGGTGAR